MEKIINVSGMHCKSCEMLLTDSIGEIKGVQKVTADHKKGMITIILENENLLPEIKNVIETEGYKVV